MALRGFAVLFFVTIGLGAPLGARAAPDSGTKGAPASSRASLADSLSGSAKDDYEAGKLLFSDGDYAGAALKFERAHAASKDPRLLWNQAAAEKNLRRYARAEALLRRYLDEGGELSSEAERAEAAALIDAIQDFIAEVRLQVSEPGAEVFVDDVSVGASPLPAPLRLDMGKRQIRVKKPGFRDAVQELELAGARPRARASARSVAGGHERRRHHPRRRQGRRPRPVGGRGALGLAPD
jgi:tetratricopeptide (TPR) repeat protein